MKNKIVLLMPIVLIITTALVFRFSSISIGRNWATIVGFLFYQITWCILFPLIVLGKKDFFDLFYEKNRLFQRKNMIFIILLLSTIIGALIIFFNIATKYSILIFLLGIPLTTINGICEEILWRGVFIKKFRNNIYLSIIYPSIFFSLWHISPQLVDLNVNLIEIIPFAIMTLPLGLIYGIVAYRTGSIKWSALAHCISGILAFGIPLSSSFANIIGIPLK